VARVVKLPLDEYCSTVVSRILNINTVVEILLDMAHVNNWSQALEQRLPKRINATEGRKARRRRNAKLRKAQGQGSDDSAEDSEGFSEPASAGDEGSASEPEAKRAKVA